MRGWRWTLSLGLLLASASCDRSEDCRLYHSCSGSLIDWAVEKMPDDKKAECRKCLDEKCPKQAKECAADWECNLGARCRMSTDPHEYQTCIQQLYRHGFSDGTEPKKPWEGRDDNEFDDCRHNYCSLHCVRDPYDCNVAIDSYEDASVTLAVQKFGAVETDEPSYGAAKGVQARACSSDACDAGWMDADTKGHIDLTLPDASYAESVYFEIRPNDDLGVPDFPQTLYYPRMLGDSKSMFGSVYVVPNVDIEDGNESLGFGHRVLKDRAQSVVLPDGCTRERVSVPNVRIRVKNLDTNTSAPQCYEPDAGNKECVWYSDHFKPTRASARTDEIGSGGGGVALPQGRYDVEVLNDKDEIVARRRHVKMRNGWMTIVRTWPVLGPRSKAASNEGITPPSGSPDSAPATPPPARSLAPAP